MNDIANAIIEVIQDEKRTLARRVVKRVIAVRNAKRTLDMNRELAETSLECMPNYELADMVNKLLRDIH